MSHLCLILGLRSRPDLTAIKREKKQVTRKFSIRPFWRQGARSFFPLPIQFGRDLFSHPPSAPVLEQGHCAGGASCTGPRYTTKKTTRREVPSKMCTPVGKIPLPSVENRDREGQPVHSKETSRLRSRKIQEAPRFSSRLQSATSTTRATCYTSQSRLHVSS